MSDILQALESPDAIVARAQSMLTPWQAKVDRCRHPNVAETTLWIFDSSGKQIGSLMAIPGGWQPPYMNQDDSPPPQEGWLCHRLYQGLPTSERKESSLAAGLAHIMTGHDAISLDGMTEWAWRVLDERQQAAIRDTSGLCFLLRGKEGKRVQVTRWPSREAPHSSPVRFTVGLTGPAWKPRHVELASARAKTGRPADPTYYTVKSVEK